jgi:CHAT domain-containing protein
VNHLRISAVVTIGLLPLTVGNVAFAAGPASAPDYVLAQTQAVLDEDYAAMVAPAPGEEPVADEDLPPRPSINPFMFTPVDLNGDGRPDWRVNYYRTSQGFCGTGGCLNQLYVSRPDGGFDLVFDQQVLRIETQPAGAGRGGVVTLELHGSACSGTGGMACPVAYQWNEPARTFLPIRLPNTSSRPPLLPLLGPDVRVVPQAIRDDVGGLDGRCRVANQGGGDGSADRAPDLDGDGRADWIVKSQCTEGETTLSSVTTVWLDRAGAPLRALDWSEGALVFDLSDNRPVIIGEGRDGCYVGSDIRCKSTSFRWNAVSQSFAPFANDRPAADQRDLLERHEALFAAGLPAAVPDEVLSAAKQQTEAFAAERSPTDLFLARARLVEGGFRLVRGDPEAEAFLRRAGETFGFAGEAMRSRYVLANLLLARSIDRPARASDRSAALVTAISQFAEDQPLTDWRLVRAYELYIDTEFRLGHTDIDARRLEQLKAAGAGNGPNSWAPLHRLNAYEGALARAEFRWQDALAIDRKVLAETLVTLAPDAETVADERGRVALDLVNLARFDEAADLAQAALSAMEQRFGPDDARTLGAASATGDILTRAGRFGAAEALLRLTTARLSARPEAGYALPLALRHAGVVALILGRLDEARSLLDRARAAEARLVDRELFADNYDKLSTTRILGRLLALSGDAAAAREIFAGALPVTSFVDKERPERIAFLLDLIEVAPPLEADGLALLGSSVNAPEPTLAMIAEQVLSIARASLPEDHPEIVRALRLVARARIIVGDPTARDAADAALAAAAKLPGDGVATGLEMRTDMVALLTGASDGDLARAGQLARQASSIARERRSRLRAGSGTAIDPELKRGFLAPIVVATAIEARGSAVPPALVDEAFTELQSAEISQAAIATARAYLARRVNGTPNEKLLADFTSAEERARSLDRLYVAALAAGDAAASDRLRNEAGAAQAMADARDTELRAQVPGYAAIADQTALPLAEVQRRLPAGAALLLVGSDDRDVAVVLVTGKQAKLHVARGYAAELADAVARLRCTVEPAHCAPALATALDDALTQAGWTLDDTRAAFDRTAAYGIYRRLFANVLAGFPQGERLLVVQQGTMSRLPLAILPTDDPDGVDRFDPAKMGKVAWLSDVHAIEQLPSVATLRLGEGTAAAKRKNDASFIGYGNPAFAGKLASARGLNTLFADGADDAVRMAVPGQLARLAALPGTQRELEAMASVLDARRSVIVTGRSASEAAVKIDGQLAGASVVAFATHGLLPNEIEGIVEPGLVFTPPISASERDDGLLVASEVAALHFDAELVILSACNTASTSGEPGADSLSALARAFLLAGSGSVMATRWSVPDDSTATLTVEALRNYGQGAITRAEALRRAMVSVRTGHRADGSAIAGWQQAWAHPQAWGGFVQIGVGD